MIKLLLDNRHYGDALDEFNTLDSLGLNNVVSAFSQPLNTLKNESETLLPVSREITISGRGVFETALFSNEFSIHFDGDKVDKLTLRCKNRFHELKLNGTNSYSVPKEYIGCRLLIPAKPNEKLVLIEK